MNNDLLRTTLARFGWYPLLLAPVFSNYILLGNLSYGDFSLTLSLFFLGWRIRITNLYLGKLFILTFVIYISWVTLTLTQGVEPMFYRASFYLGILFVLLFLERNAYSSLLPAYMAISWISAALLLGQAILFYVFHQSISLQLPLASYEIDAISMLDSSFQGFRPGGLFREPSYFALFTLPAAIYAARKKRVVSLLFFSLALAISTSSLGFLIVGFSAFLFVKQLTAWTRIYAAVAVAFTIFILTALLHDSGAPTISRFFDIFLSGGTLIERFMPIFNIYDISGLGPPSERLHSLVGNPNSDGQWYNSSIYLVANFGWFVLIPMLLVFVRVGFFYSAILLSTLLMTHAFSTAFFTNISVIFLALKILLDHERILIKNAHSTLLARA